jgi:short-subunit dehydrogenase
VKRVLITGATSAIAQEAARAFANDGARLALAGRSAEKLGNVADDLSARGAGAVETLPIDLMDLEAAAGLAERATAALGGLDVVLVAQGTLPDQEACEQDVSLTLQEMTLNALSVIAILGPAANALEAQGSGCLAVITSVAGVRGRRSNYVYGSAKAAVSTYLEGLRGRLAAAGVAVVDVRPGFVDTPMTAHLPKNPLFASAKTVGVRVHRAIERGEDVVYTPGFWRPIVWVLRAIPGFVFKRLTF